MQQIDVQHVVTQGLSRADLRLAERTRVSEPVFTGLYSQVFRVDLSCPMALKVCRHPETGDPDPKFARRQFEELSRIHEAMQGDPRYRVPRPILLIEEHAMLLMEWVIGDTLGRQLRSIGSTPGRLAPSIRQAGVWLRRFHHSGPRSRGRLEAGRLLGELRDYLPRRAPAVADEPFVREAIGALERALPWVEGQVVERSWLHGDFQLDNLVLSGDSIVGMDVAFSRQDAGAFDVACFINSLDRFFLLPWGWHLLPFRRRLLAAFLEGYAGPGAGMDPVVLAWMRTVELLRFLAVFAADGKSRLHDWYFLGNVRLLLRRLATDLERAGSGRREAHS